MPRWFNLALTVVLLLTMLAVTPDKPWLWWTTLAMLLSIPVRLVWVRRRL